MTRRIIPAPSVVLLEEDDPGIPHSPVFYHLYAVGGEAR